MLRPPPEDRFRIRPTQARPARLRLRYPFSLNLCAHAQLARFVLRPRRRGHRRRSRDRRAGAACAAQPFANIPYATWSDDEPQYRLYPGDELDVAVPSAPELNKTVTVQPDGRIMLPLVAPADGRRPQRRGAGAGALRGLCQPAAAAGRHGGGHAPSR